MTQWTQVRRVVIIVDTAIESPILAHIVKSGAKGYTCTSCFGRGRHETLEDPFTGRSRVRIEILAKEPVAEAIMAYVHEPEFASYPITAFMDTVDVDPRGKFY
jgi:nitrogen regulatory protein PII